MCLFLFLLMGSWLALLYIEDLHKVVEVLVVAPLIKFVVAALLYMEEPETIVEVLCDVFPTTIVVAAVLYMKGLAKNCRGAS